MKKTTKVIIDIEVDVKSGAGKVHVEGHEDDLMLALLVTAKQLPSFQQVIEKAAIMMSIAERMNDGESMEDFLERQIKEARRNLDRAEKDLKEVN